jgi:hypothetical protein
MDLKDVGSIKIQPTSPLQPIFLDGASEIAHFKLFLECYKTMNFVCMCNEHRNCWCGILRKTI